MINAPKPYAQTDFGPAPADYIAGAGRGAVGFITRSDIGPATRGQALSSQIQVPSLIPGGRLGGFENDLVVENDMADYSEAQFDNWSGYGQPIFNFGEYDEEDKQADEVYRMLDQHMDQRRKKRRESRLREEIHKNQEARPTISQQFSDLKRDLKQLSYEDWMSIPETGDFHVKKKKRDRFTPLPDTVIDQAHKEMERVSSIDNFSGIESSLASSSNLNDLGSARGAWLSMKLDKQSESVIGTSTVDKKGYITDLASLSVNSVGANLEDFDKARKLIQNLLKTNPNNANSWISAARVEELDGKLQKARNLLDYGLKYCEKSEDLWLEAARLASPENSRALLGRAVQNLPKSLKIWLQAAQHEQEPRLRKEILKRALENIPNESKLWVELIELEKDQAEAKALLYKAVKCVPGNLDMWLALAKLETYENAKSILNSARRVLPTEVAIWIYAAKLEESSGKTADVIETFLEKGLEVLTRQGYILNLTDWIREADIAERSQNPMCCRAIIRSVMKSQQLSEHEKRQQWLEVASDLILKGANQTCREIYSALLDQLSWNEEVMAAALDFEKAQSNIEQQKNILEKAVAINPTYKHLWIELIKLHWKEPDLIQKVFEQALSNVNDDDMQLLLVEFEMQQGNVDKASQILQDLREKDDVSEIVWIASIEQELKRNCSLAAYEIGSQAINLCKSKSARIYVHYSRAAEVVHGLNKAREILNKGLERYGNDSLSIQIWIALIELEIRNGNATRARSILEKAQLKHPGCPDLWILAINLELQEGNRTLASYIVGKSLKTFSQNSELWGMAILLEPHATRTKKILDAINSCGENTYISLAAASLFWKEGKPEKTKRWIDQARKKDPTNGDAAAFQYLYLSQAAVQAKETDTSIQELERFQQEFESQEIMQGRLWNKVKNEDQSHAKSKFEILKQTALIVQSQLDRIE